MSAAVLANANPSVEQYIAAPISISITAQPLGAALNELARSTGLEILFQPTQVEGQMVAPLQGLLTPQQAVTKLLDRSNLLAAYENGVIVIKTRPEPASPSPDVPMLSEVLVLGNRADEAIFLTPGASSYRGPDLLGNGAENLLRNMPGAFTQHETGSLGLRTNIRGLAGFGRVQSSIDGVSQSSTQANPGHGEATTSTYVDDNFIAGIEMQRGAATGATGAGALAGTVNFRTIGVDDVITGDRHWGITSKYTQGSNGYGRNGMTGVALKLPVAETGAKLGLLAAYSGRRTEDFKNADGIGLTEPGTSGFSGLQDPGKSTRNSTMLKAELIANQHHSFDVALIRTSGDFQSNTNNYNLSNTTSYLKYRYTPDSPLVDLRVNINGTRFRQQNLAADKPDVDYGEGVFNGARYSTDGRGFDITNTSLFDLGSIVLGGWRLPVSASLNLGFKEQRNDFSVDNTRGFFFMYPMANQRLRSTFGSLNLNIDRFDLLLGAHYNQYRNNGSVPPCAADSATQCFPNSPSLRSYARNEHSFDPQIMGSYRLTDWFQLYAGWSKTSRSPTPQEFIFPGANTDLAKLNPFLKMERSENREIGFNIFKDQVFNQRDGLRMKANYFNNKISDYIVNRQFVVCLEGSNPFMCNWGDYFNDGSSVDDAHAITLYINSPDTSRIRGFELEGGYTWNNLYLNLTYTKARTELPLNTMLDLGIGQVSRLPDSYWRMDIGGKFLEDKLIAGLRVNYEGVSYKMSSSEINDDGTNFGLAEQIRRNPKIIDLYASYQFVRNGTLFLNVTNVFDKKYQTSMSYDSVSYTVLDDKGGTGRGRTLNLGVNYRF